MTIKIEATGATIADAVKVFGANLELADTDTLVAELRHRLASEASPRVLRILPFADTQDTKNAGHKGSQGRKAS